MSRLEITITVLQYTVPYLIYLCTFDRGGEMQGLREIFEVSQFSNFLIL